MGEGQTSSTVYTWYFSNRGKRFGIFEADTIEALRRLCKYAATWPLSGDLEVIRDDEDLERRGKVL